MKEANHISSVANMVELYIQNFPFLDTSMFPALFFEQWGTVFAYRYDTDGGVLVTFESKMSAFRALEDIARCGDFFVGRPPLVASLPEQENPTTIFVGQIADNDQENIASEFSRFGEIKSVQIFSRQDSVINPRTLKHSALVLMNNRTEALTAIKKYQFEGRSVVPPSDLIVKEARSRAFHEQDPKLFVGMLPVEMEEGGLGQLFSLFGAVEEACVMRIRGHSRGCGWVRMANVMSCELAIISLNGKVTLRQTEDPPLFVDFARRA